MKAKCDRILAHVSGTINCDDAEDRQCQHQDEKQPVEPENFSEKRRHEFPKTAAEYSLAAAKVNLSAHKKFGGKT